MKKNKTKYNIFFTLKGPANIIEAPNNTNPIEVPNLEELLIQLSVNLPVKEDNCLGIEIVGIRIEQVE